MAAPNSIVGSDSDSAIQQSIQQLPSGHLSQRPQQSQIVVGSSHLTNPTWSAIHAQHSIQQPSTRQQLLQHHYQPRAPYGSGNTSNVEFTAAALENTSAVIDSCSETSVSTDVNSMNNVIVNIAGVNSPTVDVSMKGSVAFLANNNILRSNNSGSKMITNDGHIEVENVRAIQQQRKTSSLLGTTSLGSSMVRPNLAPGWRRIKYNHEIIYMSPSGVPLRNITQVKEYLLSVGTCKCGLPCPFDLETLFEFDVQVPNVLLDSDVPNNFCLHRSKYIHKGESVRLGKKSNKLSNISKSDSLVEAAAQNPSMAIQEVRLLQKDAEKILSNKRSTTSSNVLVAEESPVLSQQRSVVHEKEITSIPLSKTPPWRKHAILSSTCAESPAAVKLNVPIQPSTVIKQRQNHPFLNPVQTKISIQSMNQNEQLVKNSPILSNAGCPPKDDFNIPLDSAKLKLANKKRPNFKDDPTGYLNQQTAILHSSISTLHSPDGSSSSQEGMHQKAMANAESSELVEGDSSLLTRLPVEASPAKTGLERTVVQVQQNCDISHMKLQQQLQFQQQLKRQNQLVRQHHEQLQLDSSGSRLVVSVASESPVLPSAATFTNRTVDVTSTSFSGGAPDSKNSTRSPLFHGNFAMLRSESPESFTNRNLIQASSEMEILKQQNISNNSIGFAENSSIPRSIVTTGISADAKSSLDISKSAKSAADRASELVTLGQPAIVKNEKVMIQNSTASNDIQNSVAFSAHTAGLSQQGQMIPQQPPQILMTPNAQIIVMSAQQNKNSCGTTVIDGGSLTQNVIIPQQQTIMMGGANTAHQYVNVMASSENTSPISSQAITKVAGSSNINCSGMIQTIDHHQKQHSQASSNFLISSSNNMQQTVILNNGGNVVQSAVGGQQMLAANNSQLIHSGNVLTASNTATKGISSAGGAGIIANQSGINHLLGSSNPVGMLGQSTPGATVVLNSLPSNSIVIQHQPNINAAAADGRQLVNQVLNLDGSTTSFVQQQQLQNMISPDAKRKAKKRKSSGSATIISAGLTTHQTTPQLTLIPSQQQQQSPVAQQTLQPSVGQSGTMLQLTPQYPAQSFQLSPSISGLTIMPNKAHQQPHQQQQQIILQNGQIISQPYNIISQQLLLPAGIVMAPDATTLVQIQNVAASCNNIITPQGVMIRTPGPQQSKSYLSTGTGQQFICNNAGQVSPMGTHQIYGGPVNIVVPQQQASTTQTSHFIHQQGASLLQQSAQQHLIQHKAAILSNNSINDCSAISETTTPHPQVKSQKSHRPFSSSTSYHHFSGTTSPPDTTTHSPHSPEYASSEKSGESVDNINVAMVQCVSSSEPDLVSPSVSDRAHSPSETSKFFEQSGVKS